MLRSDSVRLIGSRHPALCSRDSSDQGETRNSCWGLRGPIFFTLSLRLSSNIRALAWRAAESAPPPWTTQQLQGLDAEYIALGAPCVSSISWSEDSLRCMCRHSSVCFVRPVFPLRPYLGRMSDLKQPAAPWIPKSGSSGCDRNAQTHFDALMSQDLALH